MKMILSVEKEKDGEDDSFVNAEKKDVSAKENVSVSLSVNVESADVGMKSLIGRTYEKSLEVIVGGISLLGPGSK
ncbi:hypothetical protein [Siminovitchia terrae]|uniref:Uncharacterized protein n=1 Tax=Siminovitchia terrae TaxID=1914933 RepID=A0A429XAZ1_SIMTE|nr:hypothetical protein [Siminovitchia terrae]RST60243.1 hypothetical protein D5F11_007260 [Siminovitchia terrae]